MDSLVLIVDGSGSFRPIIDRLEFERFPGEVVRTFAESDTIETLKNAGLDRTCIIVTDSLVASPLAADENRTAGTEAMIKQAQALHPACRIIVYSTDFFGLHTKFAASQVDFISSAKRESYDYLFKKMNQYATAPSTPR